MTYRDKTTGKMVNLRNSETEFLVSVKSDEPETVNSLFSARTLRVTRSSNEDSIFIVRPRTETESAIAIRGDIDKIRNNRGVQGLSPAVIDDTGNTHFIIAGRVTVMLRPDAARDASGWSRANNFTIVHSHRSPGLIEVEVPAPTDVEEFLAQLNGMASVVYAEPLFYGVDDQDLQVQISVALRLPTDAEEIPSQAILSWNLQKIDAMGAWQSSTGSNRVVVAIVDGLPQLDHEAIQSKFVAQPDESLFFSADRSESSHATAVASLVAGESARMTGIAPDVRILPIVVNLQSQTYAERADAVHGVAALARTGSYRGVGFSRVVMSCSWKTSGDIASIRVALQDAIDAGVLPIFSAGNDGTSDPHYPSAYAGWDGALGQCIVSVAATDDGDRKAAYSCFANSVSISAPGGEGLPFDERDILCADLGSMYSYSAGTSLAAPHVAAVAALMLSVNPALTPADLKRLLLQSADDISALNPDYVSTIGKGRLDARQAMEAALAGTVQPVEEPPGTGTPAILPPEPPTPAEAPPPPSPGGFNIQVDRTVPADDYDTIIEYLTQADGALQTATSWSLVSAVVQKDSIQTEISLQ